jgi:RNA polymerase sigma-70 factor (ECF subfamily)
MERTGADPVTALFERHRPRVERYLRKLVRNEADAEDLVQETFLRASRSLGDFRGEAEPTTWLYRIATNVCLDFYRRRQAARRDAVRLEEGIDPEDLAETAGEFAQPQLTAEMLAETSEMGRCVREYVDSLPESLRASLILHDLEGLSNPEVARALGWSLEKTKVTVHRARRRLREVLESRCTFYRDERNALRCDRRQPGGDDRGSCG